MTTPDDDRMNVDYSTTTSVDEAEAFALQKLMEAALEIPATSPFGIRLVRLIDADGAKVTWWLERFPPKPTDLRTKDPKDILNI